MPNFTLIVQGKQVLSGTLEAEAPPPATKYYRVIHEWENPESRRRTAVPEVYWTDATGFVFNQAMQELSYQLFRWGAPSLPEDLAKTRWTSLYNTDKAFTNFVGFDDENPRANYITGEDLNYPDPEWDKHRICGGAALQGDRIETVTHYNYMTKRNETNPVLYFNYIDVAQPLPTLQEVIDKHLYFDATICYQYRTGMFPNGIQSELGIYEPTLVPLFGKNPVFWPLKYLQEFAEIPDAYKFYMPSVAESSIWRRIFGG